MKLAHWINLLATAALIGFAIVTWSHLPERIPVHFGADGQPTRWSEPSFVAWFGLPALTVALVAFIYWMARLLPHRPDLINVPDKQRFVSLPTTRRAIVIGRVQEFMYATTAATIGMMGLVQVSMYRGAMAGESGSEVTLIIVIAVLLGPALLVLWFRLVSPELERQIREHRAEVQGNERAQQPR